MVGLKRSLYYYHLNNRSEREDRDVDLLKSIATRFKVGNKKIAKIAQRDYSTIINHKRIARLRKKHDLLPKAERKKRARLGVEELPIPTVTAKNEVWAIDFMSSRKGSSLKYRIFNVVDVHSKISPVMKAEKRMSASKVIEKLEQAIAEYGRPKGLLSDNGPEFRSKIYVEWCLKNGIEFYFTKKGRPVQNCYIESFNSCVRKELLNEIGPKSIEELGENLESWRKYYNFERPHGALDYLTPMEYVS